METENEKGGWRRRFFVGCVLCDVKMEVKEFSKEVFEFGWFELAVLNKNQDYVGGGYICGKCFQKYFL